MPRPIALPMVLGLLSVSSMLLSSQSAFLSYQGRLVSGGAPQNGRFDFAFALTDAPTDGNRIGAARTNLAVAVSNGNFSVELDSSGWVFDESPRWLEIWVRTNGPSENYTLLSPRQKLSVTGQSLFAYSATQAQVASRLSSGGASLTVVPASSLAGRIPLSSISGITSNQLDAATDLAYRSGSGLRGVITPFDCGARGNGFTDDTKALQQWIDWASSSNLVAFLPPAPGGFYKISDTLYVSESITIIGAGGGKHATSYPYTRCMLKQFSPGKHGLKILTANDSIRLESFAIASAVPWNWTNNCYGVWFAGGTADSDCSVIDQVLVMGFGVGIMASSQADTSFRQCSFGFNGTGINISGIANNVALDSCQLSYNYKNQVRIQPGSKVTIQNSDFAAGAEGMRSAQGLYCEGQDLIMIGNRFEDYTTNACLIAAENSKITLVGTYFLDFSQAVRHSIIATNSHIVALNCHFGCVGPNGVPIADYGYGKSSVLAFPPVKEWLSNGTTGYVNTASAFVSGRTDWTGVGPGPGGLGKHGWALPGTLEWGSGTGAFPSDNALWAFGMMQEAGYSGLQAVDLLAYAKQQKSGLQANGLSITNLNGANIMPGTITTGQMDPAAHALYANPSLLANNQTNPVTLAGDLTVAADLHIVSGSIVVQTNGPPSDPKPKAWLQIKTQDGQTWKIGLSQ